MLVDSLTRFFDTIKQTLFIVGSGLIVFLALRNSVVWHMQAFWGASADFWRVQWENICILFNYNGFMLFVVASFIFTLSVFWLANALLILLDLTGWPSFLLKYKIQQDQNNPLRRADLMRAVKVALRNQLIAAFFMPVIYAGMYLRGCPTHPEKLPTFHWAVFEITIFTLVEELLFYYTHRLFHHPRLYRHIHKSHHEWTAPIGLISIYAHPIEHILSNLTPPAMGPILMGSHLATTWMWWALALVSTTIAHCGYHMPFLPSPEAHDYHHLKFTNNFGVLGILDRLHGTDIQFRNSLAFKRHFMLLSLTPVAQQIPEEQKKKPE